MRGALGRFAPMLLKDRIALLGALGDVIKSDIDSGRLDSIAGSAYTKNPWFTRENTFKALKSIAEQYLNSKALETWMGAYELREGEGKMHKVGLIPAGNIPLVGIHDLISIFITGNIALVKPSGKDEVLLKYVVGALHDLEPKTKERIVLAQRLNDMEAVIATGSNNTHRYFEHYFGKYPNLLRKNRTSVAVLTEDTTEEEMKLLGEDVFTYFGLGCRSVSKVYVPQGYAVEKLLKAWEGFDWLGDHNKYHNNYMYHKSVYLVNKISHFDTGFALLSENEKLFSPIGAVYYEQYGDKSQLNELLGAIEPDVQVVVSGEKNAQKGHVYYGNAQSPGLSDYADNVDTVDFLASL